jgi:hypothetical protein
MDGFRTAYRRPDYRADLRALPSLLQGRWFLISAGLIALGFVSYAVYPASGTQLAFTLFSEPPGGPTIPIFLVGFTATRASYLLGLILGVFDLVLLAVFLAASPTVLAGASLSDIIVTGMLTGLPTAVLFAAAAAWYRRFLGATSPRGQQARGGGRSKSAARSASKAASTRR